MTIKNFFKLFPAQQVLSFKHLKGKSVAIDAMGELYRAALGMGKIAALSDNKGRSTVHINTLLSSIVKYYKHNVVQIWVFDNPSPNKYKMKELEKRRERRENATTDIGKFVISSKIIKELQFMLVTMGIPFAIAPKNVEAECVCARLNRAGHVDFVVSRDADTVLFGAKNLLKAETGGKFSYWDVEKLKEENKLDDDVLIKMGLVLGCDFIDSSIFKGIGMKTVLKKIRSGDLDERFELPEVREAYDVFKNDCGVVKINNYKPFKDKDKLYILRDWLVKKNFKVDRVNKALGL